MSARAESGSKQRAGEGDRIPARVTVGRGHPDDGGSREDERESDRGVREREHRHREREREGETREGDAERRSERAQPQRPAGRVERETGRHPTGPECRACGGENHVGEAGRDPAAA